MKMGTLFSDVSIYYCCCCCRPAAAVATAVLAAVIGALSQSSSAPLLSLRPPLPPPTCSATARSKLMACCARSSLCLPERNALPPAARSAVGSSTLCVFYTSKPLAPRALTQHCLLLLTNPPEPVRTCPGSGGFVSRRRQC